MSAKTDSFSANSDESILNVLFDHCDHHISGQVKANELIERVKAVWPQQCSERESKIHLNDLAQRLDSTKDNCYVDRATFIKCGLDWIEHLRVSDTISTRHYLKTHRFCCHALQTNCNNNASLSTSSVTSDSILSLIEEELEKKSLLDATFGSIEAINGASFSAGKPSIVELQEEIEELKNQIMNLNEERAKMAHQINLTEDSNLQLSSNNQELKQRLNALKISLDKALLHQTEIDELKTLAENKEEEKTIWAQTAAKNNSRVSELMHENIELRNRLDETMDQLSNAMSDLKLAKSFHNSSVEKLKVENEEIKVKLNESMAIKQQLENRIDALKSDLTNARESQYFQRTPSIFETEETDFFSPSFDDDPFAMTKLNGCRAEGDENEPTANSTPFLKRLSRNVGVRGSISDEIKVLDMREISPFCEKSFLHNESGVTKTKETAEAATQTPLFKGWFPISSDENDKTFISTSVLVCLTLTVLAFTFFGAVDLGDGKTLLPILWSPYLPEPVALLSIRSEIPSVW